MMCLRKMLMFVLIFLLLSLSKSYAERYKNPLQVNPYKINPRIAITPSVGPETIYTGPPLKSISNSNICKKATKAISGNTKIWNRYKNNFVREAKRRGLDCGVNNNNNNIIIVSKPETNITHKKYVSTSDRYYSGYKKIKSDAEICIQATITEYGDVFWAGSNYKEDVQEAQRRGLSCGVKVKKTPVNIPGRLKFDITPSVHFLEYLGNESLCDKATDNLVWPDKIWSVKNSDQIYVNEAKSRRLHCGVNKNKTFVEKEKKYKFKNKLKPSISSAELEAERKKRIQLERELTELKNKQKQEQQRINTDNQRPIINAFSDLNGSNAIISGRVTDNIEVVEVLIDGQVQKLKSNGTFETDFYIPRGGKIIEIVAYDTKGNKASKVLKLERGNIQQASGPVFDELNPSVKKVKSNPNALALIIGISDYSKTKANAVYADKDAQQFYDYATMKLGIPANNIKELINDKADLGEIGLAVQDWIARSTKKDKTNIYIFFAGHGLASDNGKDMYLLPYDGRPRLLHKTALLRDELFKEIQQANPRSVTVFLDTCYSGTTRGTDMLVASRPIMIKAKEQSIPSNFTVFSAAAGDQTSKPLEEAKHGMFSYFLMKGMEGDADSNNDNKITARELHAYVEQNVVQQSSGSQTPELQGDKDRVLVQFN